MSVKVYDIYDVEKEGSSRTSDSTKKVLHDYFSPKKNVRMEKYMFKCCKQSKEQISDEFVTELWNLARNCEFKNIYLIMKFLSRLFKTSLDVEHFVKQTGS